MRSSRPGPMRPALPPAGSPSIWDPTAAITRFTSSAGALLSGGRGAFAGSPAFSEVPGVTSPSQDAGPEDPELRSVPSGRRSLAPLLPFPLRLIPSHGGGDRPQQLGTHERSLLYGYGSRTRTWVIRSTG